VLNEQSVVYLDSTLNKTILGLCDDRFYYTKPITAYGIEILLFSYLLWSLMDGIVLYVRGKKLQKSEQFCVFRDKHQEKSEKTLFLKPWNLPCFCSRIM